ncbi:MAG: PaaI family thioesterase [Candidatus Heimdallarchaeota archaeon]|nr:MAG: PaaI family thioesterase [Candidatus Heimdallarchaeota archaeon]
MKNDEKYPSKDSIHTYVEIPNNWDFNCFGCSQSNEHGLQLRFYFSEKGCFTECTIPEYLCGFDGIVHGGIIATLLDEVAAWTVISQLFRVGITTKIITEYINPVRANTKLRVEGEISKQEEKCVVVHSTVSSIEGTLLAEAESEWLLPSLSSLAKIASIDESILTQIIERVIQPIQQTGTIQP